jgi:hypothetical protein
VRGLGPSSNLGVITADETGPGAKVTTAQATEAIMPTHCVVADIVGLMPAALPLLPSGGATR